MKLEDFLDERIEENKELFTRNDLLLIEQNKELAKKLYLLGTVDGSKIMDLLFW